MSDGDRGFALPVHIYAIRAKPIRALCGALGVERDRAVSLTRWRSLLRPQLLCSACKAKAIKLRRGALERAADYYEPIGLEFDTESDAGLALVESLEKISAAVEAAALVKVEAWNLRHAVGVAVIVRRDNGQTLTTTTRSPAQVLGGHSAVIWVEGVDGCYLLDRVEAVS